MTAEIMLWISLVALLYSYVLYPMVMIFLSATAMQEKEKNNASSLPHVSVIMPVYNEEKVIKQKLDALLHSVYPEDKLEILIGSDCSDDNTDTIAGEYANKDKRVTFYRSDERIGKAAMLNRLSPMAAGEILIITDANVFPDESTIERLASNFTGERTGLCDATVYPSEQGIDGISLQENMYSKYETMIKRAEGSLLGAMTGPYGGCYAVRKNLFPMVPENILVDDLFVGLTVLKKGYSSFNVPDARVSEDTQPGMKEQFTRRVRIAAGSFQNLFHFGPFPGKPAVSACFFSHKVIRWFTPFFLLMVFMTTVILSAHSVFYFCLLTVQVIFIFLPALDIILIKAGVRNSPIRFITHFLLMNIALARGFIKAVRGIKRGVWEPTKRVNND